MTTLAGSKILRKRLEKGLTRAKFGALYAGGVPGGTVQGWEMEGKRAGADSANALARNAICDFADWFAPARCPRCEAATDGDAAAGCRRAKCPIADRVAA